MTVITRFLSFIRTPGWRRAVLLRRVLAVLLLGAALILLLRDAGPGTPRALVFTRPVVAGSAVERDDVALVSVPPALLPSTAVRDPHDIEGRILAVDAPAGEIVSTTRFIGTDLNTSFVGEITTVVPVRLSEPEILPLLQHGDEVTVLAGGSERAEPDVISTGGRVILVDTRDTPGTLLIGLPEESAHAVAAASLSSPLAVVLTSHSPNHD
ncbi:SAF domain-containing protein [Corynebacterium sp.]|uniref:SAF domain-containing protein n=1 Tax=Corynebacterium sp. TaxID=1720 RepID=UPI0026DEB795|nr:SAF domain-containing protein [Corynebacterium sp.]MDO5512684.1 SAF domain-containing protein [Corynebacterium sp.]